MKNIMLIFILLLIPFISAVCESGQIDINSASATELDELYGIGPAKAQAIIDARNYNNVDDLINAYGIGEITLSNIKSQGLACVAEEKTNENSVEKEIEVDENQKSESKESTKDRLTELNANLEKKPVKTIEEPIALTPQIIKNKNDTEKLSKSTYAIFGLIGFCVLLGILFLFEKNKYKKNEFR